MTSLHKDLWTKNNLTTFRLLHYPPIPHDLPEDYVRCEAHTDYGTFTFLFQDDQGGLEVSISILDAHIYSKIQFVSKCKTVKLSSYFKYIFKQI